MGPGGRTQVPKPVQRSGNHHQPRPSLGPAFFESFYFRPYGRGQEGAILLMGTLDPEAFTLPDHDEVGWGGAESWSQIPLVKAEHHPHGHHRGLCRSQDAPFLGSRPPPHGRGSEDGR